MLIIVDDKISPKAKEQLSFYGDLLELKTAGITYPAISGHPDIFFCQAGDKLIVAPNLPEQYFEQLNKKGIEYITGEFPVGAEYPASARYNATVTPNHLIHNFRHTDFMITRTLEDLNPIHVDQGYCRCNLLPLKDDHFITSDRGIYKVLTKLQHGANNALVQSSKFKVQKTKTYPNSTLNIQPSTFSEPCFQKVLFISPEDILLEGFPHGFFGGCCGVWEDKVFVNGSLDHFTDGKKVRNYLGQLGYEIVELNDTPLEDCGSIIFCH